MHRYAENVLQLSATEGVCVCVCGPPDPIAIAIL